MGTWHELILKIRNRQEQDSYISDIYTVRPSIYDVDNWLKGDTVNDVSELTTPQGIKVVKVCVYVIIIPKIY